MWNRSFQLYLIILLSFIVVYTVKYSSFSITQIVTVRWLLFGTLVQMSAPVPPFLAVWLQNWISFSCNRLIVIFCLASKHLLCQYRREFVEIIQMQTTYISIGTVLYALAQVSSFYFSCILSYLNTKYGSSSKCTDLTVSLVCSLFTYWWCVLCVRGEKVKVVGQTVYFDIVAM